MNLSILCKLFSFNGCSVTNTNLVVYKLMCRVEGSVLSNRRIKTLIVFWRKPLYEV